MTRRLLTLAEAAAFIGVKDCETVRRLTRVPASQGGLPYLRIGSRNIRIDTHDLERWIQTHKRRAPEARRTSSSSLVALAPPPKGRSFTLTGSRKARGGGATSLRGRP